MPTATSRSSSSALCTVATRIEHGSGATTIYPNPYQTLGGKRGDLLGYQSAKTIKGEALGFRTAIMYLMPHTLSGSPTLCPYSTPGCRSVCLSSSGQLGMQEKQRLNKTLYYRQHKQEFLSQLLHEIHLFVKRETSLVPCVRLNGTTDIMWEREAPELFAAFPKLVFYDYTKIPLRYRRRPSNYYLTYSLAETPVHVAETRRCLETGEANVAIPFDLLPAIKGRRAADPLPARFGAALFGRDYPVIDGDLHDLRFLDQPRGGAIVGLRAKGAAQAQRKLARPSHGFIVHANPARGHLGAGRGRTVSQQAGGGMTNTNPVLLRLLYG
jgi:hypothetical protein